MAFADPQSVTINAVAQSMPRVSSGDNKGGFRKEDGLVGLSFSHSFGKKTRRLVQLNHAKIAADPFITGVNLRYEARVYLVTEFPETGYTNAEQKQIVDALTGYLTASSGANVTKILGGES